MSNRCDADDLFQNFIKQQVLSRLGLVENEDALRAIDDVVEKHASHFQVRLYLLICKIYCILVIFISSTISLKVKTFCMTAIYIM